MTLNSGHIIVDSVTCVHANTASWACQNKFLCILEVTTHGGTDMCIIIIIIIILNPRLKNTGYYYDLFHNIWELYILLFCQFYSTKLLLCIQT